MHYLFLDESGDLGFDFTKKGTSGVFIITCLFTENKKPIEKIIKNIHSQLNKKLKKKSGVLHAFKEKPVTRQRLLKKLAECNCSIMTIYLNKKKVYTKLYDEKAVLYNYVTNILLDRICSKRLTVSINSLLLIASRRETNKFLNENFKRYLKSQAIKNSYKMNLAIEIKSPYEEKALQAVDFVSWAIFRKYQFGDESYYNTIKKKIIEERPLFP